MHLVQAGASILSNGKIGSIKHCGSGVNFNVARSGESTVGCGLEAATGFNSHALRETSGARGGVTILASLASGPLTLTPPRLESGSAPKRGGVPPSSSEWQEFWDDEVEASYYYNCVTGEALWVRPDGF